MTPQAVAILLSGLLADNSHMDPLNAHCFACVYPFFDESRHEPEYYDKC
jgi:hypothetical protein